MRIKLCHALSLRKLSEDFPNAVTLFSGYESARFLTTDSREAEEGDIFAALPGKNTSGEAYILSARARGVAAVLHTDTLRVLTALAAQIRAEVNPFTVAVTGSVGKTGTKELLRALFSGTKRVFASAGNYNNELGVPLMLLSMPQNTEIAILELGMRHAGEIASLSQLVKPDYAVITAIGQAHLASMGSMQNIRKAKFEIVDGLKKDGALFLGVGAFPPPDFSFGGETHALSASYGKRPCVYGITPKTGYTSFHLMTEREDYRELRIPVMGAHMAKNAALAALTALRYGISEAEMREGLLRFRNAKQRSDVRIIKGVTLIEDCYNACPESMLSAAELLRNMRGLYPGRRAFALIGDMLELGKDSEALHLAVGQLFGRLPLSGLYLYGEYASVMMDGAKMAGFSGALSDNPCKIRNILVPGDILLVKASRGMQAEKLIAEIFGEENI